MPQSIHLDKTYKRTALVFENKISLKILEHQIKEYFDCNGYKVSFELEKLLFVWLKNMVNSKKFAHTQNVVIIAKKIANIRNANSDKVVIASILHDCAKNLGNECLKDIALKNKLGATERELSKPRRLHGLVGSYLAEHKLGIKDTEILNAIKYHSKGRIIESEVENIVFMADKLEKFI